MPGVSLKPFDLLANAVRAKEIAVVLVRHGFAEIIEQIETPGAWWQRFVPTPKEHRSTYERFRRAAEELFNTNKVHPVINYGVGIPDAVAKLIAARGSSTASTRPLSTA